MPGSGGKLHEVGPDFGVGGARRLLEHALTALLMDCMLTAHAALWRQYLKLHNLVIRLMTRDELCGSWRSPASGP